MSKVAPARIAILGLNYAPEEVGIGPFTRGMAEGLARLGHPVHVICGQPYYPQWKHWPGYSGGWTSAAEAA